MNSYRFEDLQIGQSEAFDVEVTKEMLEGFYGISGDENPLHRDAEFARSQGYEDKVVYGLLTGSFLSRLAGVLLPGKYCLLQGVEMKFLRPVYVGSRLHVSGTVDELHESVKRVGIKVTVIDQNNKKVLRGRIEAGFLKDVEETDG